MGVNLRPQYVIYKIKPKKLQKSVVGKNHK